MLGWRERPLTVFPGGCFWLMSCSDGLSVISYRWGLRGEVLGKRTAELRLCIGRLSLGSRADVPCDRPVLFLQVKKHMQDLSSRVSRARHNEL